MDEPNSPSTEWQVHKETVTLLEDGDRASMRVRLSATTESRAGSSPSGLRRMLIFLHALFISACSAGQHLPNKAKRNGFNKII